MLNFDWTNVDADQKTEIETAFATLTNGSATFNGFLSIIAGNGITSVTFYSDITQFTAAAGQKVITDTDGGFGGAAIIDPNDPTRQLIYIDFDAILFVATSAFFDWDIKLIPDDQYFDNFETTQALWLSDRGLTLADDVNFPGGSDAYWVEVDLWQAQHPPFRVAFLEEVLGHEFGHLAQQGLFSFSS